MSLLLLVNGKKHLENLHSLYKTFQVQVVVRLDFGIVIFFSFNHFCSQNYCTLLLVRCFQPKIQLFFWSPFGFTKQVATLLEKSEACLNRSLESFDLRPGLEHQNQSLCLCKCQLGQWGRP